VSPIRSGNEMAPMQGAQKGAEVDAGKHGYGMSAMIKIFGEQLWSGYYCEYI